MSNWFVMVFVIIGTSFFSLTAVADDVIEDLDQVQGMEHFPSDEASRALLKKNGFVVLPEFHNRIYKPYLNRPYITGLLPPFITADSLYRSFWYCLEKELKILEVNAYQDLCVLIKNMLDTLSAMESNDKTVFARDFFQVAWCLAKHIQAPVDNDKVVLELAYIRAADGIHVSPLFEYKIDYSQFRPKGFYADYSEPLLEAPLPNEQGHEACYRHITPAKNFVYLAVRLRRHYQVMQWFNAATFRLKSERETHAAMLIAQCIKADEKSREIWNTLDEIYSGLIYPCDYPSVKNYANIINRYIRDDQASDQEKYKKFLRHTQELRNPRHNDMILLPEQEANWVEETKGMRFMGRRYLPDEQLLKMVVAPNVPGRLFPSALDMLVVNGSARAREHLAEIYDDTPEGQELFKEARLQFVKERVRYSQSLYSQILTVMESLTAVPHSAAPPFAQTTAYDDKNMMTASAIWTSMHHAWLFQHERDLMSHSSSVGKSYPLPLYIEPNPAFFQAMRKVLEHSMRLLHEYVPEYMTDLRILYGDVMRLEPMLEKQLVGIPFSDMEKQSFYYYGDSLASIQDYGLWPLGEQVYMSLIVDIFEDTSMNQCLEAATGGAMPIYVIAEFEGKLQLFKGAVYSYYEFTKPIEDKLTDETWQEYWDKGNPPPMPEWTKSFIAE